MPELSRPRDLLLRDCFYWFIPSRIESGEHFQNLSLFSYQDARFTRNVGGVSNSDLKALRFTMCFIRFEVSSIPSLVTKVSSHLKTPQGYFLVVLFLSWS